MIEFVITGPDARARAETVGRELADALGYAPEARERVEPTGERGLFEVVTIALMIPPAILATLDLVERVRVLRGLRALIDKLPPGITARRGDAAVPVDAEHARAVLDLAADARPAPIYDVFLSTAPDDAAVAASLAEALRGAGLRTYWRGDLLPGDVWPLALWNAQRNARATVALVSAAWPAQWYQTEELVRGIRLKREWDHGVIPVYRDGPPGGLDDIPPGIAVLHSVDLRAAGAEKAAALIADALARRGA